MESHVAKAEYKSNLQGVALLDVFNGKGTVYASKNGHEASITNKYNDLQIILTGDDLTDKGHRLTGGTVDEIVFAGPSDDLVKVSDKHMDAKDLGDALAHKGIEGMIRTIFAGDDKINGSNTEDTLFGWGANDRINGRDGDDYLNGGSGQDVLTGGRGNDFFMFTKGYGNDTITDFDRKNDHDLIVVDEGDLKGMKIIQQGDDTVLEFKSGNTLTLLGVDADDISRNFDFQESPDLF